MHIIERDLTDKELGDVKAGFEEHNSKFDIPTYKKERFTWVVEDEGKVIATAYGDMCWDWFYLDILYVDQSFRNQDIGTKLLENVETFSKRRELVGVHLTTTSWQALDFYKKNGYEEYAVFKDFPKGHKKHCLRKYFN